MPPPHRRENLNGPSEICRAESASRQMQARHGGKTGSTAAVASFRASGRQLNHSLVQVGDHTPIRRTSRLLLGGRRCTRKRPMCPPLVNRYTGLTTSRISLPLEPFCRCCGKTCLNHHNVDETFALYEGLARVRQAAEGLDKTAIEFARMYDGDSQIQTQSERQRQAIKTAREDLNSCALLRLSVVP
jgi:hypothetical protein